MSSLIESFVFLCKTELAIYFVYASFNLYDNLIILHLAFWDLI